MESDVFPHYASPWNEFNGGGAGQATINLFDTEGEPRIFKIINKQASIGTAGQWWGVMRVYNADGSEQLRERGSKTGDMTNVTMYIGRDNCYSSQPINLRYFARTDADGNRIGIRLGKTPGDNTETVTWEANLIPCKRLSDGWPGLYDTIRTNTDGTHFFPANAKDAFTCHYETTTQTAEV